MSRLTVLGVTSMLALTLALSVEQAPAIEVGETARTTPPAMRVFFGTTHAHTGSQNNHGVDNSTAEEVLSTAKEVGTFDWFLLTEHSGPTGPADPATYYSDAQEAAAELTEDGEFVGLIGYEYSDNGGDGDTDRGHLTGFGTNGFVSAASVGMGFRAFLDLLVEESADQAVFTGFNHPGGQGHPASARNLRTPARRRVVALSEATNQLRANDKRDARFLKAFLKHLNRGWRVAPTCGMDTHGLWGLKQPDSQRTQPCRTGLLAPSLTRDNVIAAVLARRVYATRDLNLKAKYSANGEWMGSQIGTPARVTFVIKVNDPDTNRPRDMIRRVDILGRDGVVLEKRRTSAHFVSWRVTVRRGNNPYMMVRVFSEQHRGRTALLAPVWFR